MVPQQCFSNNTMQVLHKYADLLLLVLIAILGYWASGIDAKLNVVTHEQLRRSAQYDEVTNLRSDITVLKVQMAALDGIMTTLKRHEMILQRLDERIMTLIDRGRGIGPPQ